MNQSERRRYLIERLWKEQPGEQNIRIPAEQGEQRMLLRSLMNIRMPGEIDAAFLTVQNAYLAERAAEIGIVTLEDMEQLQDNLYIYRGDITRLQVGAIVNAANSSMTGCYQPCHNCIDNCIHTYAGVQLRLACAKLMQKQGHEEAAGQAKITPAFNLPCDYVIHTVGPIVSGRLTKRHEELLASCYRSCLRLAAENSIESIAFCCISTGVFMFPNQRAAEIRAKLEKRLDEDARARKYEIGELLKSEEENLQDAAETGLVVCSAPGTYDRQLSDEERSELEKQLQRYEEKAMSDKDAANVAAVLLTAAANAAALAPKEQADSGQSTPAVLMEARTEETGSEVVLDGSSV